MARSRAVIAAGLAALLLVGSVGTVGIGGALAETGTNPALEAIQDDESNVTVSEAEFVEPAPEDGDEYYEAGSEDWVSYVNPRDEYRSPFLGDGSGKICVTLLNEAGDPIVGETVPNTTVTIPTGDTLSWHPHADPMTVEFPLTDNYERPLDADQFGTTSELPQGDGYMDSHCIEMHGHPEDATIEYGEVQIEGEHADKIEVVGYVQKANDTWDTDVDPIEAAESYEETGGSWTYEPGGSHGQVVAVLQLDGEETDADNGTGDDESTSDDRSDDSESETAESASAETEGDDSVPGFTVAGAVVAFALIAVIVTRRLS